MIYFYHLLSLFVAILLLPLFSIIALSSKHKWKGLAHHFGWVPATKISGRKILWLHALSMGEVVAATSVLEARAIAAEGYMVAVAAAMEAPAILSALWLVSRNGSDGRMEPGLMREIILNGSIVLLVGSFAIGILTGEKGLAEISPFIVSPFKGVLCLFLLDMGLIAGRGLRQSKGVLEVGAVAFGMVMPLAGSAIGLLFGMMIGLSTGGVILLMVLAASASYIAVPAAMRVALPEANPAIYLTLSLGVTFPFNLTLGIPLYVALATHLTGG